MEDKWERVDPLIARWKKFTTLDDGDRLAAVEHSPTSELQRLLKEFDEVEADMSERIEALETQYGVLETGDIGADESPQAKDMHRHQAMRALRQAYAEAKDEIADRQLGGEG